MGCVHGWKEPTVGAYYWSTEKHPRFPRLGVQNVLISEDTDALYCIDFRRWGLHGDIAWQQLRITDRLLWIYHKHFFQCISTDLWQHAPAMYNVYSMSSNMCSPQGRCFKIQSSQTIHNLIVVHWQYTYTFLNPTFPIWDHISFITLST